MNIEEIAKLDFLKLSNLELKIIKNNFQNLIIHLNLLSFTKDGIRFGKRSWFTDSLDVYNAKGLRGRLVADNCFHGDNHHQLIFHFIPSYTIEAGYHKHIYFQGKLNEQAMSLACEAIISSLKSFSEI